MILDETKQIELALITPVGTTDTLEQLNIRDQIVDQKKQLDKIHKMEYGKLNLLTKEILDKEIKEVFDKYNITRYGLSPILPEFLYVNATIHNNEKLAIVFNYPMRYKEMQDAPSIGSATEILRAYKVVGEVVVEITKSLRSIGIFARGHHPLGDSQDYHHLLMPPMAYHAGLGEKGRTGLLIDHVLGPMVRIGVITVNSELKSSGPVIKGIEEFCKRCLYCVPHCPTKALSSTSFQEYLKKGAKFKFKINADRCIKYFETHNACGRCVVHCVLDKENKHEIGKRMDRIEKWYDKWIKSGEMKKLNAEYLNKV